jgi:hypothetical protein
VHRFRDSFAKDCFMKGCSVAEVAMYLGDEPETVAEHYSEMDEDRQKAADTKFQAEGGLLPSVDFNQIKTPQAVYVINKAQVA